MRLATGNNVGRRYVWFTIGLIINSLGIALITKSDLGTSPISALPWVSSLYFPKLSFGAQTFIMNMAFILIQKWIRGPEFENFQWLQIVANVIFSLFIDVGMVMFSWLVLDNIAWKLASLVAGCALLGFGIAIEIAPHVITVPGEGLVRAIAQAINRPFSRVKIQFDSTMVILALLLSIVCFGKVVGIGLGTIISALIVGKFVGFYYKHLGFLGRIQKLV